MQPISIAQKKEFKQESPNKGQFIIEPLYPGYGLTLGNALRRVLLSSLEGVAITSVRIKGVDHEFSAIDGIKEDVVDIILNLKQVRFEVSGEFEEPIKLELNAKGEKEVKAGDFKKVAGVKIANPDLLIATLTDPQAQLELEAWIERGRGYLPTEMMATRSPEGGIGSAREKEIGVIDIDAIFSPIKKVAINTENVRVGEMTNWDRLILELETDGTITPEEALKKSAQILVDQFSFFLEKKKAEKKKEEVKKEEKVTDEKDKEKDEDKESKKEEEKTGEKPRKRGRPKKEEK